MSSDDHGHGGHGHDDGPSDIIPVGSWQDNFLALVAIGALVGLSYWAGGYVQGIKVPEAHHGAVHSEHGAASGGHEVGNGAVHDEHASGEAEHATPAGGAAPSEAGAPATTGGDEINNGATGDNPAAGAGAEHKETVQPEANPNVEGSKAADPAPATHGTEDGAKNSATENKDAEPSH